LAHGEKSRTIVQFEDEPQLIHRAIAGDHAAISALYDRHVDAIYHYALYRTGDIHTAEDITAEVFLRALESLSRYDERGVPFVVWLYRIAHARVIDHWRKTQRRATLPLDDLSERELTATDSVLDTDVLQHRALQDALRQVTGEQQEVIVLKFMQGLGNEEIARVMGKTVGAVKALQRRGLEALARLLKE
jgi:RNA polymerase sigma-70 factor (ECF subfamily)